MKPGILVIIITIFSMAFVSRAIGTVGDVRVQLAAIEAAAAAKTSTPAVGDKQNSQNNATKKHVAEKPRDHGNETHKDTAQEKTEDASKGTHTEDNTAHKMLAEQKSAGTDTGTSKGATPLSKAAETLVIPPRDGPEDHFDLARIVKERTAEIERRINELNEREQTLKAVEVRINEKLTELEAARASLSETAARLDAASSEDIKVLASMYANMKPAQAGQIFNAMEPSFAAGFLTQIRSESAAAILASMEPQKAYAVSVIIAGRNVEN